MKPGSSIFVREKSRIIENEEKATTASPPSVDLHGEHG
jgi:hypothetical protein